MNLRFTPPYKLKAFTLSEVLITLVVIGVVAAITMPIIVADWQKQATISGLKKVYSTMQNALNLSVTMNGPFQDWGPEVFEDSDNYLIRYRVLDLIKGYYLPYLNVAHICESEDDDFCNYTINFAGNKLNLSYYISAGYPVFVLNDGTVIVLGSYYDSMDDRPSHLYFNVDINGAKKPNKAGRDVFMGSIRITNTSTDINFFQNDGYSRTELLEYCKLYGQTCAGLIISDGWQIKDDYPW